MRLAAMATRAADDLERPMTAEDIVNSSPVYKAQQRKMRPMAEGCLDYFPDALAAVAHCSYMATQQHHPGEKMRWDRNKSSDHADCVIRHLARRGTVDDDGVRHAAKVAWRALAVLQLELEAAGEKLV